MGHIGKIRLHVKGDSPKAEDLPLVTPHTLLSVLLQERGSLGFGEKRFTNWLVGGDMKS